MRTGSSLMGWFRLLTVLALLGGCTLQSERLKGIKDQCECSREGSWSGGWVTRSA